MQSEARLEIEVKLGRHLIRACVLPTEVARTDTTSFSVNHQQDESAQESLLRYGYSKHKRPDLLQYRQLLATLDPMGMPLVSATLEGNGADDPLYLPTWQKLVKVIGHKKFVFIADCKAGSMATRAQIAANAGIYCFPVPMSGQHPQYLKQWVLSPPAETLSIRLPRQDEEEPAVGKGFEVELGKFWFNQETNKWVRWHERYLVVYSQSLAASAIRGQQQRLLSARTDISTSASTVYYTESWTWNSAALPCMTPKTFWLTVFWQQFSGLPSITRQHLTSFVPFNTPSIPSTFANYYT